MKDFEHAPDMPKFIPEDKHVHKQCYCSPFYPMPPVPSVVGGNGEMNLYESMNVLNDRVNMCIATYNDVMEKSYKALRDLVKAGEENGAYYAPDCVITEEGYDAESNATYKIIRKRAVDRHGEPIRIKMHLAYGNTTNSKIEQNIFDASKVEFADKIFIAQPKTENGWYGKTIFNGAPLPSSERTGLYTVGFTRRGTMRVYSNATDINTIINDGIEDAIGCSGVLIQGGEICSESWYNTIPNYNEKTARICMGQNIENGEVIWIAVGKVAEEGHEGMTSLRCAEILRSYGCGIAVEICEGENSGGLDKGGMLYRPENNEAQSAYAFWYISRKCFYKNDYERELAILIQNYASNMWRTYLNTEKIKNLYTDLQHEIVAREEADTLLQSNIDAEATARFEADLALDVRIDNEEIAREDADEELQHNIDVEKTAREHADEVLQDNIDDEIRIRRESDTAINLRIDAEAEARQQADASLSTRLETEVAARTAEDTRISTALENEVIARQNADTALTNRIAAEETARANADTTLQNNIDAEATARQTGDTTLNNRINDVVTALQTWVNSIVENQNIINQQINQELATHDNRLSQIEYQVSQHESMLADINAAISNYGNRLDNLEYDLSNLQQTVGNLSTTLQTTNIRVATIQENVANMSQDIVNIATGVTNLPYVRTENGSMTGTTTFENLVGSQSAVVKTNFLQPTPNGDLHISGLLNPSNNGDAANKYYVDTKINDIINGTQALPYLSKNGGHLNGALSVGGDLDADDGYFTLVNTNEIMPGEDSVLEIHKNGTNSSVRITDVVAPTNANDAANKSYVDGLQGTIEAYVQEQLTAIKPKVIYDYQAGSGRVIDIIAYSASGLYFKMSGSNIPSSSTAIQLAPIIKTNLKKMCGSDYVNIVLKWINNGTQNTPLYGNDAGGRKTIDNTFEYVPVPANCSEVLFLFC